MRRIATFVALLAATLLCQAATTDFGLYVNYSGTGANAADVLFTTGEMDKYDSCVVLSTAGSVEILASLDGTTFATTALSMESLGSTTYTLVQSTTANTVYLIVGKYKKLRMRQVGATASAAAMNCWPSR